MEKPLMYNMWKNRSPLVSIPVKGKSMFPLIDELDLVTVAQTSPEEIHPGDIVAFLSNGGFIVHRVIRRKDNDGDIVVCQKGDSSPFYTWIKGSHVMGRVVEIKSNGRNISLTTFPWKLYNRYLALVGSLWVFISGKRRGETGFKGNAFFGRMKRAVFLGLKFMNSSFTRLLVRRY